MQKSIPEHSSLKKERSQSWCGVSLSFCRQGTRGSENLWLAHTHRNETGAQNSNLGVLSAGCCPGTRYHVMCSAYQRERDCLHPESRLEATHFIGRVGRQSWLHFCLAGVPIFCFSFWLKYLQLRNTSVGNHAYENKGAEQSAMAICQHFYRQGNICPGNDTFDIDPEIETGEVF